MGILDALRMIMGGNKHPQEMPNQNETSAYPGLIRPSTPNEIPATPEQNHQVDPLVQNDLATTVMTPPAPNQDIASPQTIQADSPVVVSPVATTEVSTNNGTVFPTPTATSDTIPSAQDSSPLPSVPQLDPSTANNPMAVQNPNDTQVVQPPSNDPTRPV